MKEELALTDRLQALPSYPSWRGEAWIKRSDMLDVLADFGLYPTPGRPVAGIPWRIERIPTDPTLFRVILDHGGSFFLRGVEVQS
jgi:hypothetical protein